MTKKIIIGILIAILLALTIYVARLGFMGNYVNTDDYIALIHFFNKDNDLNLEVCRLLKPAYGWFGFLPNLLINDYLTLLVINWSFFVGLAFVFYFILQSLNYSKRLSLVGVCWLVFAYPVLKYGLALGTDMAGWFFSALTVLITLYYLHSQKKTKYYLLLASIIATIGVLTKETGGLAISFSVIYLLLQTKGDSFKSIMKELSILVVPFLTMFSLWQLYVYFKFDYSYFDWFFITEADYAENYRTLRNFLFVELSTFGMLWLYFLWSFLNKGISRKKYIISILPLSLFVLIWPTFISRILFIQFLLIIPVSLSIFEESRFNPAVKYILYVLPVLVSIGLFILSGRDSLFNVLGL